MRQYSVVNKIRRLAPLIAVTMIGQFLFRSSGYCQTPSGAQFRGVASCASSNCHGSMSPRKSTSVLQNEYITWLKKDPHSKGWKTLLSSDSKRMAWQLGIENPSEETTCLQCHSTYAPAHLRAEKFRTDDGIGCESCHGASGDWLANHAAAKTTHAENLSHGLVALEKPEVRAKTCLSCHQGDQQRSISHKIYGAGHPRLSFELDTYSALQPYHWEVDQDYLERKSTSNGLEFWYAGQIISAQNQIHQIAQLTAKPTTVFPELSTFNCYACHHSLESKAFHHYDSRSHLGHPPINVSALEMIAITMIALEKKEGTQLEQLIHSLNSLLPNSELEAAVGEIKRLLPPIAQILVLESKKEYLLKQFISYASSHQSLYYETAEQIAMVIESIEASLKPKGKRSAKLQSILDTLKSAKDYDPRQFSLLCAKYF